MYYTTRHKVICAVMMILLLGSFVPSQVRAAAPTAASDVCTDFKGSMATMATSAPGTTGLLSEIYLYIKDVVGDATKKLFRGFTQSRNYQRAVAGALSLMVVIFGIGFTMGVIQPSFGQVLIRLIKVGIIATLISSSGWRFFSDYVVKFFNGGTDQLVIGVIKIGTGVTPPIGSTPFYQFDKLAGFLIQPDTLVLIMGSLFGGGPYGMAMGGLMMIAIGGFISLLIKALRIYAVTFVARAMLLGVAPIFFIFLLFDRTKQLFVSWVNSLLSLSLQPILLFTFLSFFMVLIESAGKQMMGAELCWNEFANVQGSTNKLAFWRFKDPSTGQMMTSQMTWEGSLQCLISGEGKTDRGKCAEFPVNIIDVLSFLILVYIATRFADIIEKVAYELSNAYIALDQGGKLDQFMTEMKSSVTKKK